MRKFLIAIGLLILVAALIFYFGVGGDFVRNIVLGWLIYCVLVLPEVRIRWDALIVFTVGLSVLTILIHGFVKWFRRETNGPSATWHVRSSLLIVGMLMMMFVSGIAMVGITHQITWIATGPQPIYLDTITGYHRTPPEYSLKSTGIAIQLVEDTFRALPTRDLRVPGQSVEHSWVTLSLIYMGAVSEMDLELPWDHPENQPHSRKVNPFVLNPFVQPAVLRDQAGYGVSHFAGNTFIFDRPERLASEDIVDGSSQTLMIGEVNDEFQPWAKPDANRDPTLGLNREPYGFGSAAGKDEVLFVMVDGSIRRLQTAIDDQVLRELATFTTEEPNSVEGQLSSTRRD